MTEMTEQTMTTTETVRAMPTEADVPEIRAVAAAYSGDLIVTQVTPTNGGVLVTYSWRYGRSPAPALEAVGYTTQVLRDGLVLVTGTVDPLALLDAQIAALTAERDRVAENR